MQVPISELQGATPAPAAGGAPRGMTVILDRLEKDGYARRQANPADRRSCIVHLIPESLRKLEGVYKEKGELLAGAIARYKDSDLRLLIEFLH